MHGITYLHLMRSSGVFSGTAIECLSTLNSGAKRVFICYIFRFKTVRRKQCQNVLIHLYFELTNFQNMNIPWQSVFSILVSNYKCLTNIFPFCFFIYIFDRQLSFVIRYQESRWIIKELIFIWTDFSMPRYLHVIIGLYIAVNRSWLSVTYVRSS